MDIKGILTFLGGVATGSGITLLFYMPPTIAVALMLVGAALIITGSIVEVTR